LGHGISVSPLPFFLSFFSPYFEEHSNVRIQRDRRVIITIRRELGLERAFGERRNR